MPRLRGRDEQPGQEPTDDPPAELRGRFRVEDWTDGSEGYAPAAGRDDHAFYRGLLAFNRQREARQQWCDERGIRYRPFDDLWRKR